VKIQNWIRMIALVMGSVWATHLVADGERVVQPSGVDPSLVQGTKADSDPWPTVAANQDRRPVRRVVTNSGDPEKKCLDPCLGGSGCEGWDSEENSGCRTAGDHGQKECWALYNRYCAYKEGQSGLLVDCKTCMYY